MPKTCRYDALTAGCRVTGRRFGGRRGRPSMRKAIGRVEIARRNRTDRSSRDAWNVG